MLTMPMYMYNMTDDKCTEYEIGIQYTEWLDYFKAVWCVQTQPI